MSRRRLLHTVRMGSDSVRIYRDPQWDCYVVKVLDRGNEYDCEETSYQCARDTAAAQVRSLRRMAADARK